MTVAYLWIPNQNNPNMSHPDFACETFRMSNTKPEKVQVTIDAGTFTITVYPEGFASVDSIDEFAFDPDGWETEDEAREIAIQDAKTNYAGEIQKMADEASGFEFPSDYMLWDI